MLDPLVERVLTSDVGRMLDFLVEATRAEWKAQNKIASGRAYDSIETRVVTKGSEIVGEVLVEKYMVYQDKGVPASRIPYSPGSGAGSSKLIDALIAWWGLKKSGMPFEERKNAAFATARSWKDNDGMPSRNSAAYAPAGRVLDWSQFAFDAAAPKMEEVIRLSNWVQIFVDAVVDEAAMEADA